MSLGQWIVDHDFNPSILEAEAGRAPGQPGPQSDLQDSQSYTERSCFGGEGNKKQKLKEKNKPFSPPLPGGDWQLPGAFSGLPGWLLAVLNEARVETAIRKPLPLPQRMLDQIPLRTPIHVHP